MIEKPIFVQDGNFPDQFGILHIPKSSALNERILVILQERIHRNRMWVKLSRQLTMMGFYVFRFDYQGRGDSAGNTKELHHDQPSTRDLLVAYDFITKLIKPERIILTGTCFRARTALTVIPLRKIHDLIITALPITTEDAAENMASERNISYYFYKLKVNKEWVKLLDVRKLKKVLSNTARRMKGKRKQPDVGFNIREDIINQFSILVRDKIPTLIVYGSEDCLFREMNHFLQNEGYLKHENIEFCVEKGKVVHGFLTVDIQEIVTERIISWIKQRYL